MDITEHLINYRFYLANIKSLEGSIKVLRMQSDGAKGIDYSQDIRSSNEIQSAVENAVINIIEQENELERQHILVQAIDRAIDELEDIDKRIIKYKYMEKSSYSVSWVQVAEATGYDIRQCHRRKERALEKIGIVLSGLV